MPEASRRSGARAGHRSDRDRARWWPRSDPDPDISNVFRVQQTERATPMIRRMLACVAVMGVAAVAMTAPLAAQGQDDWDRARLHMTREGLEELLARYEQAT